MAKNGLDKILMIKSVGLLNAAIARNPSNVAEIKENLSEICEHILKKANAKDQSVNLVKQAKNYKCLITTMRETTNEMLAAKKAGYIKPNKTLVRKVLARMKTSSRTQRQTAQDPETYAIETMQNIQTYITNKYKQIMKDLSHFCMTVMGSPPCKFAIAGMGSLARKEVTPYSDFEHIILLEIQENFEKHMEYFRWFSVIFHVVVLNLQETLIPSLHVGLLNDKTSKYGDWFFDTYTSGVSFDGMMPHACKYPLGRQDYTEKKPWKTELIQPVDKMLEYLSSEESLKNGYHLNDILTATCFVYGDQGVYDQFGKGVQQHKNFKTQEEVLSDVKKDVKEDLNKFSARFTLGKLKESKTLNIKQLFYRSSTLFIAALGKIHQVDSTSCFDIINELADRNLISDNTKTKLLYAVAIACEIRLRFYMKKKSQHDYIQIWKNDESLKNFVKTRRKNRNTKILSNHVLLTT